MRYHEILPAPELAPYVNCFWVLEGAPAAAAPEPVFPDGCLELLLYLQGASDRLTLGGAPAQRNPRFELAGQMTRPYAVRWAGGAVCLVGVRFFPHTFACFAPAGFDARLLNDQTLDAATVLGAWFRPVAARLADCAQPAEAVAVLQAALRRQLRQFPPAEARQHYLAAAVEYVLTQQGHARLDGVLARLGVGPRYLEQLFGQAMGIGPKYFCRIIRFQQAFRFFGREANLTAVATACGYYDQAHFIRDFRHFTASTPGEFLRAPGGLSAAFLVESSCSYLYNHRPARGGSFVAAG